MKRKRREYNDSSIKLIHCIDSKQTILEIQPWFLCAIYSSCGMLKHKPIFPWNNACISSSTWCKYLSCAGLICSAQQHKLSAILGLACHCFTNFTIYDIFLTTASVFVKDYIYVKQERYVSVQRKTFIWLISHKTLP